MKHHWVRLVYDDGSEVDRSFLRQSKAVEFHEFAARGLGFHTSDGRKLVAVRYLYG